MSAGDGSMLLSLSLLWGGSFLFAKIAVAELPPLTLVLARVGIAGLALLLILRLGGWTLPADLRAWRDIAIMGLLNNALPFALLFWAQTTISSGLAAILNATTPIFTVLLAALIGAERASTLRVLGVLAGLAGVAIVMGGEVLQRAGADMLAELACLLAASSYAAAALWGRRRLAAFAAPVLAAGQLLSAATIVLPFALVFERPWQLPPPSAPVLAALAGLALLSTALGYVLYFRILARAGAVNLLIVTFLIPVGALLLGWLVLAEQVAPRAVLGMAVIALALAAIDGRLPRALGRRLGLV
jgi:drug/metabolite transporter (DMT)-like permease